MTLKRASYTCASVIFNKHITATTNNHEIKKNKQTPFRAHAAGNVEMRAVVACLKKQVVRRLGPTLPLSAAILEKGG